MIRDLLFSYNDTNPNVFTFATTSGIDINTPTISMPVTIEGITTQAPISVVDCEYSIISEAVSSTFTNQKGFISNGDILRLRRTSSSSYSRNVSCSCTISDISVPWIIWTKDRPIDSTPDPITFATLNNLEFSTTYTSEIVSVSGIDVLVNSYVSGNNALMSVNGEGFNSSTAIIKNGDTIQLQVKSGYAYDSIVIVHYKIGTLTGTWTLINKKEADPDRIVDQFSFPAITNADPKIETTYYSLPLSGTTITSINETVPFKIINGTAQINNSGPYVPNGNIINNQTISLKTTIAGTYSKTTTVTCIINGVSADWNITTIKDPTNLIPNTSSFLFNNLDNQELSTDITSNSCTITGITKQITITMNSGLIERNNNGFFLQSVPALAGDTMRLQIKSSDKYETEARAYGSYNGGLDIFSWTVKTKVGSYEPTLGWKLFYLVQLKTYKQTPSNSIVDYFMNMTLPSVITPPTSDAKKRTYITNITAIQQYANSWLPPMPIYLSSGTSTQGTPLTITGGLLDATISFVQYEIETIYKNFSRIEISIDGGSSWFSYLVTNYTLLANKVFNFDIRVTIASVWTQLSMYGLSLNVSKSGQTYVYTQPINILTTTYVASIYNLITSLRNISMFLSFTTTNTFTTNTITFPTLLTPIQITIVNTINSSPPPYFITSNGTVTLNTGASKTIFAVSGSTLTISGLSTNVNIIITWLDSLYGQQSYKVRV